MFQDLVISNAMSLAYPHLSKASSFSVMRLFCQETRVADAAMLIDDVVVFVNTAEYGVDRYWTRAFF